MAELPAFGDFMSEVSKARESVHTSLLDGTPNKYGERGDDEKRAMLYVFKIVMELPMRVAQDADQAHRVKREFAARQAP